MEVIVINSHFDDSSVTVVQMIFRYPSPDTRERGLEYSMAADSARHFVFDDKEITEQIGTFLERVQNERAKDLRENLDYFTNIIPMVRHNFLFMIVPYVPVKFTF